MSKRNKTTAKNHSELKAKENSLKSKIKTTVDDTTKVKLTDDLYAIQYKLKRGAPYDN